MKYRVYEHTTVTVVVEVSADSEENAKEAALDQRDFLTSYCGNGGTDKLIGVDGDDESVSADEEIEYDDVELIGPDDEDEDEEEDEDE